MIKTIVGEIEKSYNKRDNFRFIIFIIIFLQVVIIYSAGVFIAVILLLGLLEPLVIKNFQDFPLKLIFVVSILLIFLFRVFFKHIFPIFKVDTKNMWFLNTIFTMIFLLIIGFIIISSISSLNFYTSLGILISIVMFSVPVGMLNLYNLYNIKSK